VHSQFSKTRAIENGWVGKDRLHVIPHGVLDYYTKFPRDNPPAAEAGHTVLFFGAIEHYKGLDLLVRAFAKLPLHILSVSTLMVIGKPGIRMEPIRRLAASLGVGHRIVWKLRFVEEWEVASAFNSATVIALPYRDIDQSGVLMTALAFDKPVVATAIGAIPETIQNGVHGYLVPPNDVEALAAALERILRDPQIRASMEEAVRLRHRDLCWDNIARRTNEIYSAVLLGSKEIPEMPCAF